MEISELFIWILESLLVTVVCTKYIPVRAEYTPCYSMVDMSLMMSEYTPASDHGPSPGYITWHGVSGLVSDPQNNN